MFILSFNWPIKTFTICGCTACDVDQNFDLCWLTKRDALLDYSYFEKGFRQRVHEKIPQGIVDSFNFTVSWLQYFSKVWENDRCQLEGVSFRVLSEFSSVYPMVYSIGEPKYLTILRNNHQLEKHGSVLKVFWNSNCRRCLHNFFLVLNFHEIHFSWNP